MTSEESSREQIYEPPPLAEQIEPYREYGDDELAVTLLTHAKLFGGPGRPVSPADVGYSFHCPDCEENVRAVSRPREGVCRCPLCGEFPGALVLGAGPR